MRMSYQDELLALGVEIFDCPHYRDGGACRGELADVAGGRYQHGPEMGFVGDRYGEPGLLLVFILSLAGWFNISCPKVFNVFVITACKRLKHLLNGRKRSRKA